MSRWPARLPPALRNRPRAAPPSRRQWLGWAAAALIVLRARLDKAEREASDARRARDETPGGLREWVSKALDDLGAGLATGGLGLLQVLWDRNRQALHDKAAHTAVIDLRLQPAMPQALGLPPVE